MNFPSDICNVILVIFNCKTRRFLWDILIGPGDYTNDWCCFVIYVNILLINKTTSMFQLFISKKEICVYFQ